MPSGPILAVTPGDPEGIGPEIVWKTLKSGQDAGATLLCVGAREPFEKLGAEIVEASAASLAPPERPGPFVWLLPAPAKAPKGRFLPGYQSGWSIETATRLVQKGAARALVTGPISKERLKKGGYDYPGHTEFLAKLCKTKHVTMMLANDRLRVTLVTTHVALKSLPRVLTRPLIRATILHTVEHLRKWWGIARPRVAITGLNPHAGESGLFGKEEIRVIAPEVDALRGKLGTAAELHGPLPADTLFANHILAPAGKRYDAVVCMYHDQGLIPVKLLDFPRTVNVTLGLPIVRTSVDHGTGFDIAGKGIADPSSFQAATRLAIEIARHNS